jgi:hypothetical protein
MGAGTLYLGAFQATEPADSAVSSTPASSAWTPLGYTDGGLTISFGMKTATMHVDQTPYPVGTKVTMMDPTAKTSLAEATLANLAYALNNTTSSGSGSGYATLDPTIDGTEMSPAYVALIFDGVAPASSAGVAKRRRFIARKVLQTDAVEIASKKDATGLIPVTFPLHYVDSSTKPWHIVDAT